MDLSAPPRILAIEMSTEQASLAACVGDQLVAETILPARPRAACTFAPAVRDLLKRAAWSADSVRLVGVARGPGSFTGLRVAVTAAKTFAYAVGADLIALPTLAVIASQAASEGCVAAVLDAQRGQLFAGEFALPLALPCAEAPVAIVDPAAWLAGLTVGTIVTGPALDKCGTRLPPGITRADRSAWWPRAATVGRLAYQALQNGQRDDLWRLVPLYTRLSAAEERLAR